MSDEPVLAENLSSVIRYLVWLLNSARDAIARAFIYISLEHHETHDGNRFVYPFVDLDVDIAGPKYVLLRTPDTDEEQHLTVTVGCDGAAVAELFENPTVDVVGAVRTWINRNRRSTNTANCLLYEDPTISLDNVRLAVMTFGGTGVGQTRLAGENSDRDEFILDGNEDYVVKVTVAADDSIVHICPDIYEVTRD